MGGGLVTSIETKTRLVVKKDPLRTVRVFFFIHFLRRFYETYSSFDRRDQGYEASYPGCRTDRL
jgi:hypothetical protein